MLLHQLITDSACRSPDAGSLEHNGRVLDYAALATLLEKTARGLTATGLASGERVAVYLPKQIESAAALFAAAAAGGVLVPVNPLLRPGQVGHILRDCNVRVLVTSSERARLLGEELAQCHDLRTLVLTDHAADDRPDGLHALSLSWEDLGDLSDRSPAGHRRIDIDMAAILYTSGSTGRPKGVVLSHRNMVAGARSVADYLDNRATDRLLAVLPLSFDYGLSQLSTAFLAGASVVLMEYLLPRDVVTAVARHRITGLAAVPPLWNQIAPLDWPEPAAETLRYITSSGGRMPRTSIDRLRRALPRTRLYLMYGLTEAFRSTFLPPEQIGIRPDSIGKAIPNAEVRVVRPDGTECAPGEPGELVHRGALVALGYWNDPERSAERFRPAPQRPAGLALPEMAVWSGDQVRRDEEGYLYFLGRKDDMIKTSGYRVSPSEVEEIAYVSGAVSEAAALGIPHPVLGQAIVLAVVTSPGAEDASEAALIAHCQRHLPNFMVPRRVVVMEHLARTPNGKIDRHALAAPIQDLFAGEQP